MRFLPRIEIYCSRGTFRSRLYYSLVDSSFAREQKAFLAGKLIYNSTLTSPDTSAALLRRNVHRLEKGILMQPRRTPFALDYIEETVAIYESLTKFGEIKDQETFLWASENLREYFKIHSPKHPIAGLKNRFLGALDRTEIQLPEIPQRTPYLRDLSKPPPVCPEAFAKLSIRRRSVRWYLQTPVDRKIIDRALESALQAPSACNRQPFIFRLFDQPELVRKITSLPGGVGGYDHNIPSIAVVVGRQRNYFNERDRHLIYIDASLTSMAFVYALETEGVATCCINWPDIEDKERAMKELLSLEDDERPIMLIAYGWPDPNGKVANSTKKQLSTIRRYNYE